MKQASESNRRDPHRPLIHVGYPKTATTWLQNEILADQTLGFNRFDPSLLGHVVSSFIIPNPYTFDPEVARSTNLFDNRANPPADHLLPVITYELLIGNPLGRSYHGYQVAHRLHATFPGAKIFISIREQKSMALSLYREYLKQGGVHDIESFIGKRQHDPGFRPHCDPDFFLYDQPVELYQSLFGKEQVLVLPYELLRSRPKEYLKKFTDFCGTPEISPPLASRATNVGRGALAGALRRPFNRLLGTSPIAPPSGLYRELLNRLEQLISRATPMWLDRRVERKLKRHIAYVMKDRYDTSNRTLSSLIDIDLEELGYSVQPLIAT
jgi:hypothetical protein